ncbi:unnamed protein product [Prunus armeniaca]|uniref:Uncharacterized protein n=1 Tax=Prunus armeniaca TaxID=36596 RepID=A0A6J5UBA3_PRUAR|nr:unnamed protein product [Prunus armeniaca]
MFSLCAFIFFFTFSLFIFSFSVFKILRKTEQKQQTQNDLFELKRSLSETLGKTQLTHENDPTHISNPPHKLLVEILPSDSPKWASLFVNREGGDPDDAGSGLDVEKLGSGGDQRVKKKKRRAKKKSSSHLEEEEEDSGIHIRDTENSGPGLGFSGP